MAHTEQIKQLLLMDYGTKRTRVRYQDLRPTQKKYYKKSAKELIEIILDSMNHVGFRFESVKLLPRTGDPIIDKNIPFQICRSTIDTDDKVTPKDALIAKDKICLSDKRYHELRRNLKINQLPTLSSIKKKRKAFNNNFNTTVLPLGAGAFVDLQVKVKTIVENILKSKPLNECNTLKIKYSGDGTMFGRVVNNLNVTFTILNEGDKAKTAAGNYLIGTFKIQKEDYQTLQNCLQGLIHQIEEFNELTVGGHVFKIQKYFGGDLKFLAIMLGINAANANQPCLWCTINLKQSENNPEYRKQTWSMIDKSKGARSIEDAVNTITQKEKNHNGYVNLPLIKSIPINRYVIDMLHLFLRITDKLLDLFVENLQASDALKGFLPLNLDENSAVKKFFDDLSKEFKILSPYKINNSNKNYELRSLRGPEKERIFKSIKLKNYAPNFERVTLLQWLWDEFWIIYTNIKKKELTSNQVKQRTSTWVTNFRNIYHEKHVTPYIHSFEHHLHEFINEEPDVNQFNQQGLEHLNSLIGYAYDHGTNKSNNYCTQLINRQNRIDLADIDAV